MKKNLIFILFSTLIIIQSVIISFAASSLDPNIPIPYNVNLSGGGEVTWSIDTVGASGIEYIYKKFELQLMKRYYDEVTKNYEYKDNGSSKTYSYSGDGDYSTNMTISTPGYYKVKIRAYTVEGTYGNWSNPDDCTAAAFESDDTISVTVNNGSQATVLYGPGTVDYTGYAGTGMQVQSPFINQYQQTSPYIYNGGYYNNSGYNNPTLIYQNGQAYNYQALVNQNAANQGNIGIGPGYANNVQATQTGPGITNGATNVIVGGNGAINTPGNNIYNTAQIIKSGPNINGGASVGTSPSTSGSATGISGGDLSLEVGWHQNSNGFYYYLGNGKYLKDQWYLIDNAYYRFDQNGYAIVERWFLDPTNNTWYYLGGDGKMLTGWKQYKNKWYYMNPQKGTYYGAMYSNCSISIGGKYYAFDNTGACIMNAQYGGYYYGADGTRQG